MGQSKGGYVYNFVFLHFYNKEQTTETDAFERRTQKVMDDSQRTVSPNSRQKP